MYPMFNEKWTPLACLDGPISYNICVELNLLYTFCRVHFSISHFKFTKINTTMKTPKTLVFQLFHISFRCKSQEKWRLQGCVDGHHLPCINVHNFITNMKPINIYAGSALCILTFPLEEGVCSCSFLSTIDNSTKFLHVYTEKLRMQYFHVQ